MSDTELIKDKLDIVDFISEYVQLKPAGLNHKGLCPFHHEKTPSFMASRERQSWHCFGCNKGGDIFSFLQEIEGMEFVEALKHLARRAGVELSQTERQSLAGSERNRLKEVNHEAARFFHYFLLKMDAAKPARDYLAARGLKQEIIEDWQIGFIPDQWDLLTKYLLKKGYSINDLVASGLTIKRDDADESRGRGFYDRFRGRVMFPIADIHDEIVGFTGRVLVESEHSGGKYVNTPQTPVYDKSRVVFGLNKAKQAIKTENLIVMVEGQMDVVACHQAGMKNVVASSGTALTERHVNLLKRYATTMAIAFDADAAGQNAAKRGIDLAREAGLLVRVISIPQGAGKDPDECVKNNPEVWRQAVAQAQDIMVWYMDKALKGYERASTRSVDGVGQVLTSSALDPRARQLAVNEVLVEIARIPFAMERDHWLKILATRTGEEIGVLRENMLEVKKAIKTKSSITNATETDFVTAESKNIGKSAPSQPTKLSMLFERLLVLLLKFPILNASVIEKFGKQPNLEETLISLHTFGPLYSFIKKQYTETNSINILELRDLHEDISTENKVDLLLMKGDVDFFGLSESETRSEFEQLLTHIHDEWQHERMNELARQLREAEISGDTDRAGIILSQFKNN